MNSYERAVIDTARAWRHGHVRTIAATQSIERAIDGLEEHERTQAAAGTAEIEWSLVCAGDEIKGRSGSFFPVIRTRAEVEMGSKTGRVILEIGLPGGPRSIVRPIESEPFATVRRGPDGQAVDEFVHVFSSGEA